MIERCLLAMTEREIVRMIAVNRPAAIQRLTLAAAEPWIIKTRE
jgi:hypothetical protein